MKNEKWKNIKNFEGFYQISNYGRVKSLARKMWNGKRYWFSKEKILKPYINTSGYCTVSLMKNNQRKTKLIHRLVAEAFLPNPENKREVNHLKEKINNHVDFLVWATPKENMRHAFETKRINHEGIKNGAAKLNDKKVKEIRKKYSEKDNFTKIGKLYGVSYWTISQILKKQTWVHV